MKKILAAISILFSLAATSASAETITLIGSPCDLNRNCYPVLTDDPADLIQIYDSPSFSTTNVIIDGITYTGLRGQTLTNPAGLTLVATIQYSSYITCTRSGRGQHCSTHWAILNGSTIVR
jgi:hypothetical protein